MLPGTYPGQGGAIQIVPENWTGTVVGLHSCSLWSHSCGACRRSDTGHPSDRRCPGRAHPLHLQDRFEAPVGWQILVAGEVLGLWAAAAPLAVYTGSWLQAPARPGTRAHSSPSLAPDDEQHEPSKKKPYLQHVNPCSEWSINHRFEG